MLNKKPFLSAKSELHWKAVQMYILDLPMQTLVCIPIYQFLRATNDIFKNLGIWFQLLMCEGGGQKLQGTGSQKLITANIFKLLIFSY